MLIIFLGMALVVVPIVGLLLFYRSRKLLREAKNLERSFKMVPLLIHLPPLSDDIDSETRDARDVSDENVQGPQRFITSSLALIRRDSRASSMARDILV